MHDMTEIAVLETAFGVAASLAACTYSTYVSAVLVARDRLCYAVDALWLAPQWKRSRCHGA